MHVCNMKLLEFQRVLNNKVGYSLEGVYAYFVRWVLNAVNLGLCQPGKTESVCSYGGRLCKSSNTEEEDELALG